MNRLNCFVLLACLLFSGATFALRCGRSLVQPGDYKEEVIDKCGDPDSVESHYERRGSVNRADASQFNFNGQRPFPSNSFNYGQSNYAEIEVLVEEWNYDFGSVRLRKLLRFENGRLKKIENRGKGRYRR